MNRREFIGMSAMAAASGLVGGVSAATKGEAMRAYMIQLGTRMWTDRKESLDFEYPEWTSLTEKIAAAGMNMLLIDLGEGVKYASHPELAIPGSWTPERLREELKRLRGLGLEPIPKLNFSTTHDAWLGPYERMVSTKKYYEVCTDLINEVCDLFDGPRFCHLGFDEEGARHQAANGPGFLTAANGRGASCTPEQASKGYDMVVLRQGELWWHDFLLLSEAVENRGVRPWIWSDKYWTEPEEFLKRMPKSVMQSVWYYDASFDIAELKTHEQEELTKEPQRLVNWKRVQSYLDLDKAGYEQIPCGSNWSCDANFGNLVRYCRSNLSALRLKGFLMAPWRYTVALKDEKLVGAINLAKAALEG